MSTKRVLMAEVSGGGYEVERDRLNGWCEGDLEQQRNDVGGCATMKDRKEWQALVHM